MKKKFILSVMISFSVLLSFGQSKNMDEIRSFSIKNVGSIREGNEVKGYYMFYEVDKADKKNRNFRIDLFDENVKLVKSIPFVKPKYTYLITTAFNGDAIAFMFFEAKGKFVQIDSYDLDGNKLGTYTTAKIDKMEEYTYAMLQSNKDDEESKIYPTLFPAGKRGFLRSYYKKNDKYGYAIELLSNDMKKQWTGGSDPKSEQVEGTMIQNVDDKYAALMVLKRKGMMSQSGDSYMNIINLENGKSEFEMIVDDKQYSVTVSSANYDSENDDIVVLGDYYAKSEKPGKGKSTGFYIKHFDLKGKEKSKKFIAWAKDVGKFLNVDEKGKLEDKFLVFMHERYRMADGSTYLIGESYKKKADALGIAATALGGGYGGGLADCVVGDLLVFKLDPDMNLKAVTFYEKDHSTVVLPAGVDLAGPGLVATYVKYAGGFDYMFGIQSNDRKTFSSIYVNYDKEKGEKPKNLVGSIFLSPKGELSTDKIDLPIEKHTSYKVLPAKHGYIMLTEYNSKKKSLTQKLVKLNY